MTKKIATLLVQHEKDWEAITMAIMYPESVNYKVSYDTWHKSGVECLNALKEYGNSDYLYCFYNNDGKYNLYTLAKKYLKKEAKKNEKLCRNN